MGLYWFVLVCIGLHWFVLATCILASIHGIAALHCILSASINVNLKHTPRGENQNIVTTSLGTHLSAPLFCTRESRGFHRFYQTPMIFKHLINKNSLLAKSDNVEQVTCVTGLKVGGVEEGDQISQARIA